MSPIPTPDFTTVGNAAITATAGVPVLLAAVFGIAIGIVVLVAGMTLLKRWIGSAIRGGR